jgi:hypothetical protein
MDPGIGVVRIDHFVPVRAYGSLSVAHYPLSAIFDSGEKNIQSQVNAD